MTETTNIFGFNFICDLSYEGLSKLIVRGVSESSIGITNFITPNAHGIRMYHMYPELNNFCKVSQFVLPDGQPIVWLSRFTDKHIKQRLTGSDFFPVMYQHLKKTNQRSLFLLSNSILKEKFLKESPNESYIIPPFFKMEEQTKIDEIGDHMVAEILKRNINHVFIGISEPKQGALAQNVTLKLKYLDHKEPCIFYFLGASYEFYFGLKKRAPIFFQKTGLEWFYRLLLEPRRMFKRYVIGNFLFLLLALKWIIDKEAFNLGTKK